MDYVQLQKAKKLEQEIAELIQHRNYVQGAFNKAGEDPEIKQFRLIAKQPNWNGSGTMLYDRFLIADKKVFANIYIVKLNEEIARLEKEFKDLPANEPEPIF